MDNQNALNTNDMNTISNYTIDDLLNEELNDKEVDKKIKFKYYCDICDTGARNNTEWLKHTQSKKHLRGGLKPKTCSYCNTEFSNHWNLKQHYIIIHATQEEREKCKYYCKLCNVVFLSELYFNKHNISKKHINTVKCLEEVDNIEKIKNMRLKKKIIDDI